MAWRRLRGWTQAALAEEAHLSRPYVSRLENGETDPALSVLRQLAVALNLTIGQLIEQLPPERLLSREEIDRLARGALRPGTRESRLLPETRILAAMIRDRRKALGFHKPRKDAPSRASSSTPATKAARWLRVSLGTKQWDALLRRVDKLAAIAPETS